MREADRSVVAQPHPVRYTYGEYLELERDSNTKHEYLDGRIYAMAGGTPEHAALIASVLLHLGGQLGGTGCRPYMSDLHVRVLETGLATYPDIAIVCGRTERDPESKFTVVNPTVIVEVLSKSTEDYDRGKKFDHYKAIPSLKEYVLVAQDRRSIEVWARTPGGPWERAEAVAGGKARLLSVDAVLDVDRVYDDAKEPD